MFPTHVALVPYDEDSLKPQELLHVAAALQTQVTRDLGPLWNLSGVVSPFLRLEDVPPTYVPLAIVAGLPKPWHGFHIVADGQPLALVGYRKGWSLLASHELIELLCDPDGNRRCVGKSLIDGQGEVQYYVEVCDPCQYGHYMVRDVHVSDFVTPQYYGPRHSRRNRYSFTGSIERPLEVGNGGSLSWRTSDGEVWQKVGNDDPRQVQGITFSRAWLDGYEPDGDTDITANLSKPSRSQKPYYRPEQQARRHGAGLRKSIDRILEQLGARAPKTSLDAIVALLKELATDGSPTRDAYKDNPEKTLKRFKLDPPRNKKPAPLAPAETYRGVLSALDGGLGLGDPKLAAWLSTHSAFFPAGIW
jgi:hypothetical protein